jgi:hypothetical protein
MHVLLICTIIMGVFAGNAQGILSKAVILDSMHSEDQHTLQV